MERALSWQTKPPILIDRPGSKSDGALRHGVDAARSTPLGAYTEITGYGVSLFVYLARSRQEVGFLNLARRSAEYLLRIQAPNGPFPDLPDPENTGAAGPDYAFDTGTCIVGLARLARQAEEGRFLEGALAAGRWLLSMQRSDGSFRAMSRGGATEDPGGFFGDGSCIHAKNAIALLELHASSGEARWLNAARAVCDQVASLQAEDGAFWSRAERRYVFTHAHCYACEGLHFAGRILDDKRYLDAARRGIEWLAAAQRAEGGWLSHYKAALRTPRLLLEAAARPMPTDAAAQAARLFGLAGPSFERQRAAALDFLIGSQDAEGGFYYRRSRFGYTPKLYTWCAQFAVQALAWNDRPAHVEDLF